MPLPKKKKAPSGSWVCGCGVTKSTRILYCQRCDRGAPTIKES